MHTDIFLQKGRSVLTKSWNSFNCPVNYSTLIHTLADTSFHFVVAYSIYIIETSLSSYRIETSHVPLKSVS